MNEKQIRYIYKCKNHYNFLTNYSTYYDTLNDASKWYLKKGVKLEKMFNRNLILCQTYYEENS